MLLRRRKRKKKKKRTCSNARYMTREADWRPQLLEGLVYLMSIVEILVVLDVFILECHLWQLLIYNMLLITL
jgi:hypothetical protein